MNDLPENSQHLIDSSTGNYIPQVFCLNYDRDQITGITDTDWNICTIGPEHEHYDEAWCTILNNAIITDAATKTQYILYQDSDLWLVPVSPDEEPGTGTVTVPVSVTVPVPNSYFTLRLTAPNDSNGNPRRLYITYNAAQEAVAVYPATYNDLTAVTDPNHAAAYRGLSFQITIAEYNQQIGA